MTHSVEQHLAVHTETYDAEIRRFVPGYEAMIAAAMDALTVHLRPQAHLIDLGAGTGALTAAALAHFPDARVTLVDVDAAMLEEAKKRLARDLSRTTMKVQSFAEPLPACDAAMASLSLHHVHDPDAKCVVYANVRAALLARAPGGVLVTADAMVPTETKMRDHVMHEWAAHLVAHGDTEAEAFARFSQWATEDRYFSIEEELTFLRDAGFRTREVAWRLGPLAVIVAMA